jgi:hypothetical protein
MSFKVFIYYCALCGGWAAFAAWGVAQAASVGLDEETGFWRVALAAAIRGGLLGMFVAAAVGFLDALLNSTGMERVPRVFLCGVLGLLGGTIGGVVGQAGNYVGIPVFVGWVLAGVLIGASIGAFDLFRAVSAGDDTGTAIKKVLNGIYGGFIGGLIGGVPYTFLINYSDFPRCAPAVSLIILGISIGLMIGLTQVILTEAWIKVEEGFRAGRELMLSKDETTIGRAESCDLGLFGDAAIQKVHARILHKNNRYLLEHSGDDGETILNDEEIGGKPVPLRSGDRIRLGKSVLVFGERQKRR